MGSCAKISVAGVLLALGFLSGCQTWQQVYVDDYRYPTTSPLNEKFNTWFWREDAVGVHAFNHVDVNAPVDGCTADTPCVKLTAPIYAPPAGQNAPYINAEMYNNSCVRQGPGHPAKQPYDRLLDPVNPLLQSISFVSPTELHAGITKYCHMPYPYREGSSTAYPAPYAKDGWNTTTTADIAHNYLALIADKEADWKWYRDVGFNNPYVANEQTASRLDMRIKVTGTDGGSRGWGYWNTTMNPLVMQFAWFMEITTLKNPDASSDPEFDNTVWMMTVKGGDSDAAGFCVTALEPEVASIYDWHDYTIEWREDAVQYLVDGKVMATHSSYVPDRNLAFHNWVDNRNYASSGPANYALTIEKSNRINRFLVSEMAGSNAFVEAAAEGASVTTCKSFASLLGSDVLPGSSDLKKVISAVVSAYE